MKLLSLPILVIGIILKLCNNQSILGMCLDYRVMRRLIITFKQTPRKFRVEVDFANFELKIGYFRKYVVKRFVADAEQNGNLTFNDVVMPIFNVRDKVNVYAARRKKGFMNVVLDIIAKLNLNKLEHLIYSRGCPTTEIFEMLTEKKLTVEWLTLEGTGRACHETRQFFSLPFLKNVTRCISSSVNTGLDFELPVFPFPINVPELQLNYSRWFTIDHLMKFEKARRIYLDGSMIRSEDLQRYLRKWVNYEYEDLVSLTIEFALRHRFVLSTAVAGIIHPDDVYRVGYRDRAAIMRDDGATSVMELYNGLFTCEIAKHFVPGRQFY